MIRTVRVDFHWSITQGCIKIGPRSILIVTQATLQTTPGYVDLVYKGEDIKKWGNERQLIKSY